MELRIDNEKAKNALEEIIEKAKSLYDISALGLEDAKIQANDWYQQVVATVQDVFYDSKKIIKDMNTILMKEGRPSQGFALKKTFSIQTIDLEYEKKVLINKIEKIVSILEDLIPQNENL